MTAPRRIGRRWAGAVRAGILACCAAAGCAPTRPPGTIVIWHQMNPGERELLARQIAAFEAAHPGCHVETVYKETEQLRSAFIIAALARQGPDIVHGPSDNIGVFHAMGIVRPLDDLFPPEYLAQFDSKALTRFDGRLYQIADKLGNHLALVYNRALLPEPPATLAELIALGRQATRDLDGDGRPDQYGLAWNYVEPYFFIPFLTGWGGWVMDEAGRPTLDTEPMARALEFIRDLRDRHAIVPREADYNIADTLFKEGRAAMLINGDWSWKGYLDAGLDIGVAPLPRNEETGLWCAPMVSPKGASINAEIRPEALPLALEFVRFLNRPEEQLAVTREVRTMPTRLEALAAPVLGEDPILRGSARQIELGRAMPVVPAMRAIWDAMRPAYQAVLNGALEPREAAARMQRAAERLIREMEEG